MAGTTTTLGSIVLPGKVQMQSSKFQAASSNIVCLSDFQEMSKHKAKHQILRNPKLQSLGIEHRVQSAADRYKNMQVVCNSDGSGPEIPSNPTPTPGSWKSLFLGILMSVILPVWRGKWRQLLKLKDEIVAVLDEAEAVTDVFEIVARIVAKVVDDFGNRLPEGRLKETLENFENLAENTAIVAHKAGQFFQQVEDVVNDMGKKVVVSCKISKTYDKKAKEIKKEEKENT